MFLSFLSFLVAFFFFFDFVVLKNDEFVVKKPEEAARMEGSPGSVNEVVDTIPAMVSKLSLNELSANLLQGLWFRCHPFTVACRL